MGWYIFGVIALCIVLFLLKNAYTNRKPIYEQEKYEAYGKTFTRQGKRLGYEYFGKVKMPLWVFVMLVTVFLIPILNILAFLAAIVIIIIFACNNELFIHFSDKTILGRIGKFLNKDVF